MSAIAAALVFALFLSAGIGWMFVYIMVCAPIFSAVIVVLTKKIGCISITVDTDNTMMYKKDILTLRITVKNSSILPVPALLIKPLMPPELDIMENNNGCYSAIISPKSEVVIEVKYKAKYWGQCLVGIKSVDLQDFMSFIKLNLYSRKGSNEYSKAVKIFPNIPDVTSDTTLVRNVAEDIQYYDDSEETKESDGFSFFTGTAGYTHREYAFGDPVKRINWKLSARRENLMIRLDDEVEAMQQTIILDSAANFDVYSNEKAVEGVLAMCYSLVRLGYETVVWYKAKDGFVSHNTETVADVKSLQSAFADYSFSLPEKKAARIPDDIFSSSKHGSVLVYTALSDSRFYTEIKELQSNGMNVTVVTSDIKSGVLFENTWKLNDDYSAEKA